MQKIILVTRSGVLGGVEVHVSQLAAFLTKKGYSVVWVILCKNDLQSQFKKIPKVRLLLLNDKYRQSIISFVYIFKLAYLVWRLRPILVHLHGIRPMFLFSLFPFPKNTKRISTIHASYLLTAKLYNGKIPLYRKFISLCMHYFSYIISDKCIFVSKYLINELNNFSSLINFNKSNVVYNGAIATFPYNEYNDFIHKVMNTFEINELQLVFIGRVEIMKGVDTLILAINQCRKDIKIRCHIFGDGDDLNGLIHFTSKMGVDDIFHYWGPFSDIRRFLDKFDVFVLPSKSEGLSLSVMEAMMAGLPVVATRVGGIPEIVDSSVGILFDVDDYNELSNILTKLYFDSDLQNVLGLNARKKAVNSFCIDCQLENTYALHGI